MQTSCLSVGRILETDFPEHHIPTLASSDLAPAGLGFLSEMWGAAGTEGGQEAGVAQAGLLGREHGRAEGLPTSGHPHTHLQDHPQGQRKERTLPTRPVQIWHLTPGSLFVPPVSPYLHLMCPLSLLLSLFFLSKGKGNSQRGVTP